MALTEAQCTTLAAHIRANTDQAVIDALAIRNDSELARLYNSPTSPAYYIWRNNVTADEIMQNGFDWVRVDNLSVGKARIWEWLFDNQSRSINPTKANVRAGIAECWKGTAADNAVRGVVFGHCQKVATVAEKVFATGAGTSTTVDGVGPADATFFGTVTIDDIGRALNDNA